MKHHFISAALAATLLLLGSSLSMADDGNPEDVTGAASGKARAQNAKKGDAAKSEAKAVKKVKLVDINSAKKAELKKLPGIGDAEADKIIAGRPYGSKTWLVSDKVIPEGIYFGIAGVIEAKMPYKDGVKNAEFIRKAVEKKEKEKKAAEQKSGEKK